MTYRESSRQKSLMTEDTGVRECVKDMENIQLDEERRALRELENKMREFCVQRDKLNKMSEERISLGKPLTDEDILKQNETCSKISLDIMKLKEFMDDTDDE
ncbi:MAG: hypothetical protein RR777_05030 [Christensenellaceae bacterium]